MTLIMKNKHGAGSDTLEFTAASDISAGDLLVTDENGDVAAISGAYSNQAQIHEVASSLDFTNDVDLFNIAVVNKHIVVIARDTVNNLIFGVVGKVSPGGNISWGEPNTLATGDYYDLRIIPIPTENKCLYGAILNNILYVGLLIIDFDKLTVRSNNFANRGGQVSSGYELLYHPGEDRVITFRNSDGSMYAESFAVSEESLVSAGSTLIQSAHSTTLIKAAYCANVDRVLLVYRHSADSNRPYYLICAFASGVPAVTKPGTRLSNIATNTLLMSYDEQEQRVLLFGSSMTHVLNVAATSITMGPDQASSIDQNYISSLHYDPVNQAHALLKSKPTELFVDRLTVNASDNTFTLENSASKAVTPGTVSSQYSAELAIEVVACKPSNSSLSFHYAAVATAEDLAKPIIGFASDNIVTGDALDIAPVNSPAYLVTVRQTISPTETYFMTYDNKLKLESELKFIDGLVGVNGYALGVNELLINK